MARIFPRRWTPRPLKGYHAPHAGGPGVAAATPDGSEVSFFKMIQRIWKGINFSKRTTFFLPNTPCFLRKITKNWTDFRGISDFYQKNYLRIKVFMIPTKSRESPGEFYYRVEKFIMKAKEITLTEKDYWKEHENSWKFWRKSTGPCRMLSIGLLKLRMLPGNLSEFGPKIKKTMENFRKTLRFFDLNLYGKLIFSLFFT